MKESIGVRVVDSNPKLSPVPFQRDAGRKPSRNLGSIEVDRIVADPNQPRQTFDAEELKHLARSIKQKQLAPIRVRWAEESQNWVVVAGERRYRAAKLAGVRTIDCYFHDDGLSESEILEEQMVENIHRRQLAPAEEAEGYRKLMVMNSWTGKQLAEHLRVSESKVSRALAVLKHSDVYEQVRAGKLSARKGHELARIKNDDVRRQLTEATLENGLSHKQVENAVRKRRGKRSKASAKSVLRFRTEDRRGTMVIEGPPKWTYDHVEQFLVEVLEEVRHRMKNNVGLY